LWFFCSLVVSHVAPWILSSAQMELYCLHYQVTHYD
jgi:hypothetical protein